MAVGATVNWRVRPSGNNANGGGYDPGIASPGTDRSQQNAAFVAFNGTTVRATTAGVGATITLVGVTGSSADIANAINITGGTNFITGWYFITAATSSTWTLDRNCTTGAGAAMTGNMGGGWADFWTNTTSSGPLVPGNDVFILGSGTPNPSSYTFDYTATGPNITTASGSVTSGGRITFAADPLTPGYKSPPDTTGGMPCISFSGTLFGSTTETNFSGLWMVGAPFSPTASPGTGTCTFIGCVCDQNNNGLSWISGSGPAIILGCEIFSSVATIGTGNAAISFQGEGTTVIGCNIHDCSGGIAMDQRGEVLNTIIAKNGTGGGTATDGILAGIRTASTQIRIVNCTIDGNSGNGININGVAGGTDTNALDNTVILNNIISNHTGVSKAGLNIPSGAAALNSKVGFADYNAYYNNTANYTNTNAGPHDTALGVTPYVGSATQNYTLV